MNKPCLPHQARPAEYASSRAASQSRSLMERDFYLRPHLPATTP